MFKSACLRLTVWYVALIMAICLSFSAWVYAEADKELQAGLDRQGLVLRQRLEYVFLSPAHLREIRDEQLTASRGRLLLNLFYFNAAVLAGGAAASYWLAKRTMRPLRESMEAQHRFTADASHELRTPLAVMRAEIEVALRDKNLSSSEARELLRSNLEEIEKLEVLSGSLLSLAQHHNNRMAVSPKKVRLQPLIDSVVAKLQAVASKHSINLVQDVADIEIDVDPAALQEVLRILLDNAIKYSPDGGDVKVVAIVEGQRAIIKVQDDGVGIRASAIPHLFERFYREDSSRAKGKVKGFGLGLSIAKSIIDNHNGTIEVQSKPQKGSTFIIKLPLVHKDTTT